MQAGARVQRVERRLVNAEYCCELFAHVPWPNGDVMHVTVSPEGYRLYEERMQAALGALKRRCAQAHANPQPPLLLPVLRPLAFSSDLLSQ